MRVRRFRTIAICCLAFGVAGCDHLLFVGARSPLRPQPGPACAGAREGIPHIVVEEDSTAYVEASLGYINRRPPMAEADATAGALAAQVRSLHAACSGDSAGAERSLVIISDPAPYLAWSVRGTRERVWMRSLVDSARWILHFRAGQGRRALEVDTLAGSLATGRLVWHRVQRVTIPPVPKGYAIATECARGDAIPSGRLVAVVRNKRWTFQAPVLRAWELDLATLRINEVRPDGIRCRNTHWRWRSP